MRLFDSGNRTARGIKNMSKKNKNNYYAYLLPNGKSGIAESWQECERFVKGVYNARYRGFGDKADAEAWLHSGAQYETKERRAIKLEAGIYFDAGTGRGKGVEVSVTDEKGKDSLIKILSAKQINKFGKHQVADKEITNNYGELLAMKYALEIAEKMKIRKIFGDSKLVIEYWSQWKMKRKELPRATVELAGEVAAMRQAFEKSGGQVVRISGDDNPADLGFH